MPGVMQRGGRSRRSMTEINMVPFIDVMLVLLIIFMVTAPLITTGVVDLPSVGKSSQRPTSVIEIIVGSNEKLRLRLDQQDPEAVALTELVARVRQKQSAAPNAGGGSGTNSGTSEVPVIISADKSVRYESVVRVMDVLQRAGIARVGLSVKQGTP
ncbi:MAG: ExbD/TolR family protein [Pseudomonadota bacterium]|nr:ExbD/TolR family protein [Pseudomonadota bacterium]